MCHSLNRKCIVLILHLCLDVQKFCLLIQSILNFKPSQKFYLSKHLFYMDVYSSYPKLWFCSLELMVAEMPIQEKQRDIFDKKCFYFAKGFRLCQKDPFFIIFTQSLWWKLTKEFRLLVFYFCFFVYWYMEKLNEFALQSFTKEILAKMINNLHLQLLHVFSFIL